MSQEINTNKLNSTVPDVNAQNFSVSETNESINDLLAEIEQVIQKKDLLAAKIEAVEEKGAERGEKKYISIANLTLQQITICQENKYFHQQENKEENPPQPSEDRGELEEFNKFFGNNLDKMLFRCACSYLIGVLLWVVASEQFKFALFTPQKDATIAQNVQLSSDDSQFIEYLEASLKAIDHQQQEQKITEAFASTPEPKLTGSEHQNPSNSVIMPKTTKLRVTSPSLSLASAIANLNNTIAPPPPLYLSAVATVPANEHISPSLPSSPNLQLVGLLASGDRSVALFTINGITQSIKLGEKIGSSGWTLNSISEQQAVINRNGELLYMAVGENF